MRNGNETIADCGMEMRLLQHINVGEWKHRKQVMGMRPHHRIWNGNETDYCKMWNKNVVTGKQF